MDRTGVRLKGRGAAWLPPQQHLGWEWQEFIGLL